MEEKKSEDKKEEEHVIFIDRLVDFPHEREKEEEKQETHE